MQFKGAKRSAAEIAQVLHVDAFVEGTLTSDGRMIQVTSQLINAPDDRHLWADRYVRDSANVLAIESDIAAAIAREVNVRAAPLAEQPRRRRALDGVSYSLYLRGQIAMLNRTPAAMDQARTYFHQAVAQDSTFALGYAGLSEAILVSGIDGFMALRAARDSAFQFAQHAMALDSTLPQAHTALAAAYGDAAKWAESEREYRRAIDLGPSDALAYHWYAQLLFIQDRIREAYAQVKIGREIDPTSASLARTAGPIEAALGISRGSSERAAQAVLRDPFHGWSRAAYANRLSQEGKCGEARAHIDTAKAMIPDNIRMEMIVFAVEYRCGDRAGAMRMFAAIKHRPDARARGLWIATAYKTLGQTDSAFAWLDSVEWNGDLRFNFRSAAQWNASRKDPRYQRVLERMGLK
jgi:Tfp pilus assembly protein PilF